MRGSLARVSVHLAWSMVLATGCGRDPFGPPARLKSPITNEEIEPAKAIYMLVPSPPEGSVEIWGIEAQREANRDKAIFRIMGPDPDDPKTTQTDLVRKAMADGASALVVVPGDAPGLAEALAEAETKKVPVVLLGRSIPAPSGSPPFTAVVAASFEEMARKIVATTLEDAKKVGRPANGSALVLSDRETDSYSADRVAALKAAAQSAGLGKVETIPFDGSKPDNAQAAVLEAVKTHPDVVIVLGDGDQAMYGIMKARAQLKGKPEFYAGGFVGYQGGPISSLLMRESCWVEGRHEDQARKAVQTALAKIRGETFAARIEQPAKFNRGSATLAIDSSPDGAIPKAQSPDLLKTGKTSAPVPDVPKPQ